MTKHKTRKAIKARRRDDRRDKQARRAFEAGYIANERAEYFRALKGKAVQS